MTSSMAEVSYLRLPENLEDLQQEEFLALDSVFPYCSNVLSESDPIFLNDLHNHHPDLFDPEIYDRIGAPDAAASGSGSFEEVSDRENQVSFVMDLFQQRVEQSHVLEIGSFESDPSFESGFGIIDRNSEEIGGNSLRSEVGELLGLGTQVDGNKGLGSADDEDDNYGGFIVSDCGDEFFVSRRESGNNSGDNSTIAESGGERNRFSGGLNVVDFGSDSNEDVDDLLDTDLHSEDEYVARNGNDDENIALCWDSLQLEDQRDGTDEFEWEEVDGGIDILSPEESISVLPIIGPEGDEIEEREQRGSRNLEWEVLLNVNNLERHPGMENIEDPAFGDHDDYTYAAEYSVTFGQFAEGEMGRPPASKLVIQSLASIVMTDEDVKNGNVLCAVCKDEMGVGEQAKQLPCSHRYHGDCIIPWLGIRNTCPVCRHELPTDDPDYENRRPQSSAHAQ